MQLLEVKNDTAKIMYNPMDNKLLPSDFLLIEDCNQKLVGQILSVYTTENSNNNFADVKLALYIDKDDSLSYYNGYIPPRTAKVMYITSDEITEMIADPNINIYLGNLTYHQKSLVKAPMSLVNEKLYIQCDREDNRKTIMQNIVSELYMKQRKVILLDFDGRYNKIKNVPRIVVSESFKFPLNTEAFDIILEYDTLDCPIEDKAVIQGIVLELRDYIVTLENKFLPFTLFKNVVISEFSANPIPGLMLLRNKLWQYAQEGLFAEGTSDFNIINKVMKNENIAIVDASLIEEKWHKFVIQTIPKILDRSCYFAFSMNDIPMDKRSIISLYNSPNIIPIVSTSYDSPHRSILKSLSKNQILFKPSKQAEVDEQYGSLIHKLNSNDFILFGEASLNLPLIVELKPFDIKTSERIEEQEIRRNVDRILSTGKSMLPKEAVITNPKPVNSPIPQQYMVDEDFNDDDLDFLDDIKIEEISLDDLKNNTLNQKNSEYDMFSPFAEITKLQNEKIETPLAFDDTNISDNAIDRLFNGNFDDKELQPEKPENVSINQEIEETQTQQLSEIKHYEDDINSNIKPEKTEKTEEIKNIENSEIIETVEINENPETVKNVEETLSEEIIEIVEAEHNGEVQPVEEINEIVEEKMEEPVITQEAEPVEIKEEIIEQKTEEPVIIQETKPVEIKEEIIEQKMEEPVITQETKPVEIKEEIIEQKTEEPVIIQEAEPVEIKEEIIEQKTEEPVIIQEAIPVEVKEETKETKKKKGEIKQLSLMEQKEEEIVPINSIIENIKLNVKKSAKKVAKAIKNEDNSEGKKEKKKKITKNTPQVPFKEVQDKTKKKELTVYETDISNNIIDKNKLPFKEGDRVYHPKYGKGTVEHFIPVGNKTLFCRIEFENIGIRILDLKVSSLEKIEK